jgi:hypothetical protein
MQNPHRRGYLWTFLSDHLIAFRFSPSRSGETPREVLGGRAGTLVVDAYTGYNRVTDVDGWTRAGCLAHVRRKFFEALSTAPAVARRAMDLILEVYKVEHEAKERGIVRTAEHHERRQTRGRAAMGALHVWLLGQQDAHPPKSPMGQAVSYALKQWPTLLRFLDDTRIPPDNNGAESALRVAALGRKNSSSFSTRTRAPTSPACTPWCRLASRATSTPSRTYATCCSASTRTPPRASTNSSPTAGNRRPTPRPTPPPPDTASFTGRLLDGGRTGRGTGASLPSGRCVLAPW